MKSLKKPEVVGEASTNSASPSSHAIRPQFRPYQVQEIATWVKIAKDAGIEPGE